MSDYVGQQFGRLTIIAKANDAVSPKGYHTKQYLCECSCGNQIVVRGNKLTSGSTQSCGCLRKEKAGRSRLIDLTGKRFGKLVVKHRISGSDWLCVCDCGNETIKKTGALTSGNTIGCGKCRAENLTGKNYHDIYVIDRLPSTPSGDAVWHCKCDKCGAEFHYTKTQLKNITSDGCPQCRQKHENLIGQRFGRLVVESRAEDIIFPNGDKKVSWNCLCDCGNTTVATSKELKRGEKQSCGCLRKDIIRESRTLDLSNQRFGRLTALYKCNDKEQGYKWHCICDCGNECDVMTTSLTSGRTRSCGCLQKERAGAYAFIDLTGKTIGSWSVLYQAGNTESGKILWHCRCEKCGKEYDVDGGNLRLGTTTMCAECSHKENGKKLRLNLIGYRFGKLTVTQLVGVVDSATQWLCKCDCGKETTVSVGALTSGNTRSCGCWHQSKYEEWVLSYLENKGLDYTTQVKFPDLTGIKGRLLSYDFCIYQEDIVKALIECQGQQHFKPIDIFGGQEQFEIQQRHDELKKNYAYEIGADFIEIPYTVNSYNDVEMLLDSKLREIFLA